MIFWDDEFCGMLAERGHYVIRFDNRDAGQSESFEHAGVPDIAAILARTMTGQPVEVPYTLDDMADDAAGLLGFLRLGAAHVCGVSMGGMIAQTLAYRHPGRVKSLISIMSSTGDPSLPQATPDVLQILLQPLPTERDASIERHVTIFRAIGSPGFPFDEPYIRARGARAFDRNRSPFGQARQLAAILAHGDRTARLRALSVPALVIHGEDDPLIPVECGRATAAAIPGAHLITIPGMGHDNPRPVWPHAVQAISEHTRRMG
jgi:pimeloyl-ACP methyl ester carboxylesterase